MQLPQSMDAICYRVTDIVMVTSGSSNDRCKLEYSERVWVRSPLVIQKRINILKSVSDFGDHRNDHDNIHGPVINSVVLQ